MKTITLRGVDEDLSDALERTADDTRQSVNQFILDRLKSDLRLSKPKQYTHVLHDLDDLQNGLRLFTKDRHFDQIPGLTWFG